ncbi:hypothetical protein KKB17_01255 [bacterium]|nr:hypothetical protein [bacterium]
MERMEHNKLIGKKVFLKLIDSAVEDFKDWDIGYKQLTVFISGVEQNGLWLRHPNFKITFKVDKEGKVNPEANRKEEEIEADIFIPWGYVKGIVHLIDDRLKYDNEPGREIGFTSGKI